MIGEEDPQTPSKGDLKAIEAHQVKMETNRCLKEINDDLKDKIAKLYTIQAKAEESKEELVFKNQKLLVEKEDNRQIAADWEDVAKRLGATQAKVVVVLERIMNVPGRIPMTWDEDVNTLLTELKGKDTK